MITESHKASQHRYVAKNYDRLKEMRKAYYTKNREKRCLQSRVKYYRSKYGLTLEQARVMQQADCDICGQHAGVGKGGMAIDHDHETGEIRGTLCINCNQGIGKFKDNPALLRIATEYLERLLEPTSV